MKGPCKELNERYWASSLARIGEITSANIYMPGVQWAYFMDFDKDSPILCTDKKRIVEQFTQPAWCAQRLLCQFKSYKV